MVRRQNNAGKNKDLSLGREGRRRQANNIYHYPGAAECKDIVLGKGNLWWLYGGSFRCGRGNNIKAVGSHGGMFRSAWRVELLAFLLAALVLVLSCRIAGPKPETETWRVKGALAALEDPNPKVWVKALNKLGELRSPGTADKIASSLDYADSEVRQAAITALGMLGEATGEHASRIREIMMNPREEIPIRATAALALGSMGEAAKGFFRDLVTTAERPIVAIAASPDQIEFLRLSALLGLGAMGANASGYKSTLATLAGDTNQSVDIRIAAITALGKMGGAAGEHVLKIRDITMNPGEATPRDANAIRKAAATALGSMGEAAKKYVGELVDLMKNPKEEATFRAEVVKSLGTMGVAAKDAIPAIANLLSPPQTKDDAYLRGPAALALAGMGEAARNEVPSIVGLLRDPRPYIRQQAIEALGNLGAAARDQVSLIVDLSNDQSAPAYARDAAVIALGVMRKAPKNRVPEIIKLLEDSEDPTHSSAIKALAAMGPLDWESVLSILGPIYSHDSWLVELRLLAHFVGGGEKNPEILIKWLGTGGKKISPDLGHLEREEVLETQRVFLDALKTINALKTNEEKVPLDDDLALLRSDLARLRDDLAQRIVNLAQLAVWTENDILLLSKAKEGLKSDYSALAEVIENKINGFRKKPSIPELLWQFLQPSWEKAGYAGLAFLSHVLFWVALIRFYPKRPEIQAIIFWNPWVRRITTLGYVSLALTYIPSLRSKLFAPFKDSLLAEAKLELLDQQPYFEESQVKVERSGLIRPIREALPEIKGQIVLEGDSGLGKTMLLRSLVKNSKRVVVFLPAENCAGGVIEAIQEKLQGPAQGSDFLQNLIYIGAIDICIDGLNQVTAETREKVTHFVKNYFKGNIIIATQPLLMWKPPAIAKVYIIQPIEETKIQDFLCSRKTSLPQDATVTGDVYEQACQAYLKRALDKEQPPEMLDAAKRVLSNPMDLTVVARMLAMGQEPDLSGLLEQEYQNMAEKYRAKNLYQEFPLSSFSESVYQLRLKNQDKDVLAVTSLADGFDKELQYMEREQMVLTRQSTVQGNSKLEWYFRHDKIMDFFIAQALLKGASARRKEHLGDPRFRGSYLLLATLLPIDEANELREQLIQYAADTQDYTLFALVIQILRARGKALPAATGDSL